ncbi:hypothetical protein EDB89DRAFT_1913166 [Lactarius sanguifluus]|nr:hypothetical protein EDB89DRAFT_1913166 [Lactarius sanguifluus]
MVTFGDIRPDISLLSGAHAAHMLISVDIRKSCSRGPTTADHIDRPRGSCSGDVVCEKRYGEKKKEKNVSKQQTEAELVVIGWGLACRDSMASERGFRAAGYWWWWRLWRRGHEVAAAVTVTCTRPKHGGGGYGLMWDEAAAAVTWLCDSEKRLEQKKRKEEKTYLGMHVVTRVLVTIVVTVGIVGDEMHEVASLEKPRHRHRCSYLVASSPQPPPPPVPRRAKAPLRRHAVATRKTPADDDELGFDHVTVTAAATSWPRLHNLHHHQPRHRCSYLVASSSQPPPPPVPRRAKAPPRRHAVATCKTHHDGTPNVTRKPRRIATDTTRATTHLVHLVKPRPMPRQPRHANITPAATDKTSPQHPRRLPRRDRPFTTPACRGASNLSPATRHAAPPPRQPAAHNNRQRASIPPQHGRATSRPRPRHRHLDPVTTGLAAPWLSLY